MARPKKQGFEYFPLDVDIFHDTGIILTMQRFGPDGFTLYTYLLGRIYDKGFFISCTSELIGIAAWQLRIEEDRVREIIAFLAEKGLFDSRLFSEYGVLTSQGVQRRFQVMMKKRLRKETIFVPKHLWLLTPARTESNICFEEENEAPQTEKNLPAEEGSACKEADVCPEGFCTKNEGFSSENDTKQSKAKQSKAKQSKAKQSKAKQSVCAAPAVLLVPCRGQPLKVTQNDLQEYTHDFPSLRAEDSLKRAALYLQAHPDKQRSREATKAYLRLWLEQDAANAAAAYGPTGEKATYDISEYESFSAVDYFDAEDGSD